MVLWPAGPIPASSLAGNSMQDRSRAGQGPPARHPGGVRSGRTKRCRSSAHRRCRRSRPAGSPGAGGAGSGGLHRRRGDRPRHRARTRSPLSATHQSDGFAFRRRWQDDKTEIYRDGLTRRSPKLKLRLPGEYPLRYADRQSDAELSKQPPRRTRWRPLVGPVGLVTGPVGYGPNRSWHHSHTLPCMSYKPKPFGRYEPTGIGRSR